MNDRSLTVGVLIRFSTSAKTLPAVLAALKRQTLQPDVIIGINSGSRDESPAMIQAAGGRVIDWTRRYQHSEVLNFGLRHVPTDLVLILSSHTVLESPNTLARMVDAMHDPSTACVSMKWDEDPFYSDAITWSELQTKGLKFGSIYSNSMGMIRRSLWEQCPFDQTLPTAEDYAWAVEQLKRGGVCKRLDLSFSYQRSGVNRDGDFARVAFELARRGRLRVAWLGVRGCLMQSILALLRGTRSPTTTLLRAWVKSKFGSLRYQRSSI